MASTVYRVLKAATGTEGESWEPVAQLPATSSHNAISQTAQTSGSGAYVAVPLRSFKPVKVVVETKPTVQIGEAL